MTDYAKQTRKTLNKIWDRTVCPVLSDSSPGLDLSKLRQDSENWIDEISTGLPAVEDIASTMRGALDGSVLYLALHKALTQQGLNTDQTGPLCLEMMRREFGAVSKLKAKTMGAAMFTKLAVRKSAREGAPKTDSPAQFKFDIVEDDQSPKGWAMNVTQCPICHLTKLHDAQDFTPVICAADRIMSDVYGWGLKRTQTIASGASHCDFRFRKGAETEVEI